jgi:hypothetical protein
MNLWLITNSIGREVVPSFLNLVIKIEFHVTFTFHMVLEWERMVLQILLLGPSNLLEPAVSFAQKSQKLIVSPIVGHWFSVKFLKRYLLFPLYIYQ